VFLDYDQIELDTAYDQGPWLTNFQEIAQRRAQRRAATLSRIGEPERHSYGPSEVESLNLYPTTGRDVPIHIHIHGGTWRVGNADGTGDLAEASVVAGAHFVALDFTSLNETGGDLRPLSQQVRRAIAWVYEHAASFGGDQSQIFVSGHSSGGHLAGVAVTTDWESSFGLPSDCIKGAMLISGMYDLYPVSLSSRRTYVNFNDEIIEDLSPQRNLDYLTCPIVVAYGSLETPEFQRQGREFAAAVTAAGKQSSVVVADGCNHFEVLEDLGNPYGVLGHKMLEIMDLV